MVQKSKRLMIAKIGLMTAVSVIMSVPPFGTIKLPFGVDATLAHLPTILIALLEGPLYGGITGLFLGIISMVRCLTEPVGLNVFIWNPLVSVLPRILIGVVTGYCYFGLKRLSAKRKRPGIFDAAVLGISGGVGSIVNTAGVLGMMYLIYAKDIQSVLESVPEAERFAESALALIIVIASTQGLAEMLIIAVLCVILVKALRRAGYK